MSGHACGSDNHFNSALLGSVGKCLNLGRSAVCRQSVHLERNLHLVEELCGFFENGKVGSASHYDTNYGIHMRYILFDGYENSSSAK